MFLSDEGPMFLSNEGPTLETLDYPILSVFAVHRPFYISILIYIYIVSENKIWTENHKCDLDEIKSVTRVGVACAQPELLP